jgi:hypothetical protein
VGSRSKQRAVTIGSQAKIWATRNFLDFRSYRTRHIVQCFLDQILEMATVGLRYEDWFESASNFLSWKARIMFLQREKGLWSHVETAVTAPTDPAELAKHEAREARAMWMILD